MSDAARRIRLLALDVDGVLTDNAVYLGLVDGHRVEYKRFDIQDGLGLALLRGTSLDVALVSARPSDATVLRAGELKLAHVIQVAGGGKVEGMAPLLDRLGIDWTEVAFLGDDLADVPVLRRAGLPMAVANAVDEVRGLAQWTSTRPGGHGAVREAVVWLLKARGEYDAAVARYLGDRDVA